MGHVDILRRDVSTESEQEMHPPDNTQDRGGKFICSWIMGHATILRWCLSVLVRRSKIVSG